MIRDMELHLLRAFVAAAEELHVGRAATRLHVSQPTLSRQIAALEHALDAQLFSRAHRRLSLTSVGELVLSEARELIGRADTLVRDAGRAQRGELGTLRLGFVQSATFEALPTLIRAFRAGRPDVELDARTMTSLRQVPALQSGDLDVGLLRPPSGVVDLAQRVVSLDRLTVALPADHALASSDPLTLAALADEDFVFYQRPEPSVQDRVVYHRILGYCHDAGFAPRIVQEARDVQTIAALVASGLGISLLISPTPPDHGGAVVYRPLADDLPPWELTLAWSPESTNPALDAFLEVADRVMPEVTSGRS